MKKSLSILFVFLAFKMLSQIDWQHTYGPKGINALVAHGFNNSKYAFLPNGDFLYRSADGENWEALNHGGFINLAIKNDTIVGIKYENHDVNNPREAYFSIDNGVSFEKRKSPDKYFYHMAWGKRGLYTLAGTPKKLYLSDDNLQSWKEFPTPSQYSHDLYSSNGNIYAATLNEIWRLNENDITWELVYTTSNDDYIKDIFKQDSNVVILTYKSIWTSNDNGQNFTRYPYYFGNSFSTIRVSNGKLYIFDPVENVLLSSDNFGKSWTKFEILFQFLSNYYDVILFKNKLFFNDSDNSYLISYNIDTKELKNVSEGLVSPLIDDFCEDDLNIWAINGKDLFQYSKVQKKWNNNPVFSLKNNYNDVSLSSNSQGKVCILASRDTLIISNDFGQSWQKVKYSNSINFSDPEKVKIVKDVIFLLAENSHFKESLVSYDNGENWEQSSITDVVYFKNKFYATKGNARIIESLDGRNWTELTSFQNKNIYKLSANDYDIIIGVDYSRNVYHSFDGQNWSFSGLSLRNYEEINILNFESNYYLYDNHLLYCSIDSCKTWFIHSTKIYTDKIKMSPLGFLTGNHVGGIKIGKPAVNAFANKNEGFIFLDKNLNCIADPSESKISNLMIGAYDSNNYILHSVFSKSDGSYKINTGSNLDSIKIKPILYSKYSQYLKSKPEFYISSPNNSTNIDFAIQFEKEINDLEIDATYTSLAKPGFEISLYGNLSNLGFVSQVGKLELKLDKKIIFKNAIPTPNQVIGDSILIWDFDSLEFNQNRYFVAYGTVESTTSIDEEIECKWKAESNFPDIDPSNNCKSLTTIVVGSYDPNDKSVEPIDGLTKEEIDANKPFTFTIRFQNTGNYLAEKVRILDKLDPGFDFSTIKIISSSHSITKSELLPRGWLQFTFENINLPDSISDELGSHGFVKFSINRSKALNPSFSLFNSAEIYFDYNLPIYTNRVEAKTLKLPNSFLSLKEHNPTFTIYPNPTTNQQFSIKKIDQTLFSGDIEIYNSLGLLVFNKAIPNPMTEITIENIYLPFGIYSVFLMHKNDRNNIGKVVIE